jgi:hypothetical protein
MSQGMRERRGRVGMHRRTMSTWTVETLEGRVLLSGTAGPTAPSPAAQIEALAGQRPTTIALESSAKAIPTGQSVTLVATVNAQPHGRLVTSGRVRFSIVAPTTEVLGSSYVNQRGAATLTTRRLQSGDTYEIQAEYIPTERVIGRSEATVSISVAPAAATAFRITAPQFFGAPGTPVTFTVTAIDRAGKPVTDYTGTISLFSPTDHAAKFLVKQYTFTTADQGIHEFAGGVTFHKGGDEVLKVDQVSNTHVRGTAIFGIE